MQDSGTGRLAGAQLSPNNPTNFGTDLSGHHPVSIEVNAALLSDKNKQYQDGNIAMILCNPVAPVKLLPTANLYISNRGVQCTSCHDPHEDPIPGTSKFLRVPASELCDKCHVPNVQTCPN
jgi:predicted CXXCH cytochrome family protein